MSFCPVALYDMHSAIEGRLRKKEMTIEASNLMIDTFVDTMGRRLSQFGGEVKLISITANGKWVRWPIEMRSLGRETGDGC